MKKLKTIKLQGRDYVQVQERVAGFNEDYPNGRIITIPTFNANTVYFKATITPDLEKPERKFTGHSFGELGKEKALEKLETVAVGRALAFMGIGIVEGIASADEMARFNNKPAADPVTGEIKPKYCSICGQEMVMSAAGKLYCKGEYNKHRGQKGTPLDTKPEEKSRLDANEQKFADSLPEPPEEEIRIEDIPFN